VERRVVSVLFADLVGFTTLAEGRDAEEVRELLSRYFEVARQLVERYGGTVEKFIGDAVMAVWGTPVAREDDAERAVRAALELVAAITALGAELGAPELTARAAVLTGEAAVTLGVEGQGMVAGDLVNTASRAQGIAEPGTVVVGEATRRASEAAIAYADAGVHELRGREDALHLWSALRVTAGRSGSLKWAGVEPPFVGRERELRLVKELFHASADEWKAHLVTVVGIAGIGKSRLAWELYKYVDGLAQTVRWHRGRCLSYGDGVTYWALAEMVRMRAGIAEGEDDESARGKLREAIAAHIDDVGEREWIEPRLAHLLSLEEREDGSEPRDLFAGWRLFFERIAERNPVVIVFEDMQWADGALLEFLDHLLDWSRSHAIFVLALARPELADRHPHWSLARRNSTTLSLEPLSRPAMEELLDGFVPGLPDTVRAQVLDSSEGVPLYAVETVRMLLDKGALEQHEGEYRVVGTIDSLEVPETLHALIAARLDGLSAEERQMLQRAAVLGKTFPRRALETLARDAAPTLDRQLEALVRKEILSLQADPRSPERGQYTFLQDLLRQVAYETLPRRERKVLHLAAAAHLEQEWLDGDNDLVEIAASHYVTAFGLDPDGGDASDIRRSAAAMLRQAGERAASLAATDAAQRYFEDALELTDDPVTQAELHERAGRMAMLYARAAPARSHLERAIELYDSVGRPLAAGRVTAMLGQVTWNQEGDIDRAIVEMERSFTLLANEEMSPELATLAVQLARVLFFSGRVDEAMERNELALEIAEALELPEVLSHALNTKGVFLQGKGRYRESHLLMQYALEVALEHDLSAAALRAYNNLAGEAENLDRSREALQMMRAMSELAQRVGDRESMRRAEISSLRILVSLGEWDEALEGADELARTEQDMAPATRAELYQQLFFIPLQRGEVDVARQWVDAYSEFVDQGDVQDRAVQRYSDAYFLVAEGKPAEALAAAEEVLTSSLGIGHWTWWAGIELVLYAAAALGDTAKIDETLALIESSPPGHLTPHVRALGARYGADRAANQGDAVTASASFQAAANLFRETEKPYDLAVVLLEHGEWLVDRGHSDEAEPLLAEAREIFDRLRATPWLERLDRLPQRVPEKVAE
jgi:predicted ATPase/class 3 adenylate cyclase